MTSERPPLEIIPSRHGGLTCRVGGRFLHSKYNPEEEALKLFGNIKDKKSLILIGCGLGYLIRCWANESPGAPLFVLEWDTRLPPLCETHFPGTTTLPGVTCASEANWNTTLSDWLATLTPEQLSGLGLVELPAYRILYPEKSAALKQSLPHSLEESMSNRFTEWEFERIWTRNILLNIPRILAAEPFLNSYNTATGKSALLIGAGPSLAGSLDFICKAQKRADLFATDTALPVLHAAGIYPEYIVSLDGQIHNRRDFNGIDCSDSILLTEPTVYPDIPLLKFRQIIFFEAAGVEEEAGKLLVKSHPLILWIKQCIGELGPVNTGGNVLTATLSLSAAMGYTTLVFAGMDNAFPGFRYHSRGAYSHSLASHKACRTQTIEKLLRNQVLRRKIISGTDNRDNPVPTDPVLRRYAAWTEAALSGDSLLKTATISPNGLAIPGIPLLGEGEALAFLPPAKAIARSQNGSIPTKKQSKLLDRLLLLVQYLEKSEAAAEDRAILHDLTTAFPFLNRIFSRQLLYIEKKAKNREEAEAFIKNEIRFQLGRVGRYAKRALRALSEYQR